MKFALKLSTFLSLVLAVVAAALLFSVSQKVQEKERIYARLQDRMQAEEEALRVLKAEWDYLNRPDRLEELASKYLDMKSVTVDHVVQSVSAIPEPEEGTTAPEIVHVSTPNNDSSSSPENVNELPSPSVDQAVPQNEDDFNAVLDDALSAPAQKENAP